MPVQHGRNKNGSRRRPIRRSAEERRESLQRVVDSAPHEVWELVAMDGPLLPDNVLREQLETEIILHDSVRMPLEIGERVITDVLAKCLNVSACDRPIFDDAHRLLRKLRKRIRAEKGRPAHRPRKNWFEQLLNEEAYLAMERRQSELMVEARERGQKLTSDKARRQAAEEIACDYRISAAALISWWKNPKRLRQR